MKRVTERLTILVDIDNVLNNFTEVVLHHYNADHNTSYRLEDIHIYSMEDTFNIPFSVLYEYFVSPEVLNDCKPLKDARKYLRLLNELSQIYIVTARDWKQLISIDEWFNEHYPFINSTQIIRCRDKHMVQGDIRIDDHFDNLKYCNGGRILFNYPFNQDIDLTDTLVYRVNNWEECFSACMLMMGYTPTTIQNYIERSDINE